MKQIILQYVMYNQWANKCIQESLRSLSEEQLLASVGGSFRSLKEIVHHCYMAEKIWIQRLHLVEHLTIPAYDAEKDISDLSKEWSDCSVEFVEFVKKQWKDESFSHEVVYYTSKKEMCKNTFSDIIMHCMNHSTFHRGQLIHAMRQLGISSVPSTDLIVYLRSK